MKVKKAVSGGGPDPPSLAMDWCAFRVIPSTRSAVGLGFHHNIWGLCALRLLGYFSLKIKDSRVLFKGSKVPTRSCAYPSVLTYARVRAVESLDSVQSKHDLLRAFAQKALGGSYSPCGQSRPINIRITIRMHVQNVCHIFP